MLQQSAAEEIFKGQFVLPVQLLKEKLHAIKAIIFDWDGVFNNGNKNIDGHSAYSETDSMGTNLMRFQYHLLKNVVPISAIISGENNGLAHKWAKREHFHAVYSGIKHKETALMHLCAVYQIRPEEVLFVFDDVLDFSLAKKAGAKIMIRHAGNPLLIQYAIENGLVDYVTALEGGFHAVRELTELVMHLTGDFSSTITHRMQYSAAYLKFLTERDNVSTNYYVLENGVVVHQ